MRFVYLMRHGKQTDADHKVEGFWRPNATLAPGAETRITEAARALKALDDTISRFYCSPFVRTKQTLECVLKTYKPDYRSIDIIIPELAPEYPEDWDHLLLDWIGDRSLRDVTLEPADMAKLWPILVERESIRIGAAVKKIAEHLPENGRALAISHIPIINFAEYFLTNACKPYRQALKYCEAIKFTFENGGQVQTEFLPLTA